MFGRLHELRTSQSGYTLIEIVMVMVILAAFSGGIAAMILAVSDLFSFVSFRNDEALMAKIALDRMVREIREVRGNTVNDILTAAATDFQFVNSDDATIRFWLSGTNLLRDADLLAVNVSNLTFAYFAADNSQIAAPVAAGSIGSIWRIQATLEVTNAGESIRYTSEIFPRNLRP